MPSDFSFADPGFFRVFVLSRFRDLFDVIEASGSSVFLSVGVSGEPTKVSNYGSWSLAVELDVSGPPPVTATVESIDYVTSSGTNPGVDTTEALTAGEVVAAVARGAAVVGTAPKSSAIHDGSSTPSWDTEQGLDSALGGQDVHPLEYTGAAIQPMTTNAGTSMILAETSDASRGPSDETNWVSHPSAIGYRRTGVHSGSSGGSHVTIEEVAPDFDSGMNDGSTGEEMERITNFYSGADENPTAAQSAPTPRAEQQTRRISADGGAWGPAAVYAGRADDGERR